MNNRMKTLSLTIVCLTMLVTVFASKPVAGQRTRGPAVDLLRQKVTRSPAAQLIEMTAGPPGGSDIWQGLIRPTDIEAMQTAIPQRFISSRGGLHYCQMGMNFREPPLDDINYRHALAHLVPKDRIIGSLFRYIVVKVNTPVPPSQSLWYNPGVDPHPYSPVEAEEVMKASPDFKKEGGVWMYSDGRAFPHLRFFTPLEIVAPTSFTIGRMFVEECVGIGITNIEQVPMDFATYLNLVYNMWDFEIFWVCYGLGRNPTHLWGLFNSENNYLGSSNPYGIYYDELDTATDILWTSLDHSAKLAATMDAQELLMGGSTANPLPRYVPQTDPRHWALPVFAVYSRNYYDIQQPGLTGSINMYGYGTDNGWTYLNFRWNTLNNYRPGTTEKTVVRVEDEFPERLNPLFATTVYANDFITNTLEGLIAVDPYRHKDTPWLATDWRYSVVPGTPPHMDIEFDLRLTDSQGQSIKWQDGKPITVNDVKFAWDFLYTWQIPNYWDVWKHYDPANSVIIDSDTIKAHFDTTSQWYVYSLAGLAFYLPPQVWYRNPLTGAPWASTAQILSFDPSASAYPLAGNYNPGPIALPTQLFGTGPFVNVHSTTTIGTQAYGDLEANENYWLTTLEIENIIKDMFHYAGDVDGDGEVNIYDLALIAYAAPAEYPDPYYNPLADLCGPGGAPPDLIINIFDMSQAGKFYAEKVWYA